MPMEESIRFSIVLPVYGVEDYLEAALQDIIHQSYHNWELIIVDDCSPDKSRDIIERYRAEGFPFRLITHTSNRGLSEARNSGIAEAKGDYLWIPDPDDRFDSNLLETIAKDLIAHPVDVLIFGHIQEYYDEEGTFLYAQELQPQEQHYENPEALRKSILELEQQTHFGYAWNKVYSLDYLNEQNFVFQDDAALIEDILFNVEYFADINSLSCLPFAPYHYAKRRRKNLTNQYVPRYYELHHRRIEVLYQLFATWGILDEKAKARLGSLLGRYLLSALERNCDKRAEMNHRARVNWCRTQWADPLYQELIPGASSESSRILALSLSVLRTKSSTLWLILGRIIHWSQAGALYTLFTKIKSGR